MLSYQHGYHAGSFADVIKHLTLTRVLVYMTSKEKPLFYLETHSGRGMYDLKNSQAMKTGENLQGISLLWLQKAKLPAVFSQYLHVIHHVNESEELRFYPGSPSLAIDLLRPQDRLYCCELHPREFESLQKLPHGGKKVFFSHSDGIANLNALLPPTERRGLIFIDPSYEIKTDYKEVPKAIKSAYHRFATGVFCLWYPIIDNRLHEQLLRAMASINAQSALRIEFNLTQSIQTGMTGCGLWIINPPYVLAEEMRTALKHLSTLFNPGVSSFIVETL
ncbi:23S rRNA (adenine(2030)-N(6))-methyltransferase RlmJ [Legionella maceachernii]|uniref:Ribosomal RNA large subunit methyltransferase J n=1 Tax=Legionella maceachernii TaxID=466 RepID=A0A0W0VWN2_9GAMM|nr:23S rRNA (adenine(2030)-N(6))-methyltransferase RlmJ [Legionella maceachernii]KTD24440.1 protein involved in catabolism of external DNA [Legionella maceachernii]SJZ66736.1 23S rRNA (adenine2030-N6)-methyltransferase [Legionella maceachernii]SUP01987.1 Protein involved in catabolism of external DNA [Legionella maceachernii]